MFYVSKTRETHVFQIFPKHKSFVFWKKSFVFLFCDKTHNKKIVSFPLKKKLFAKFIHSFFVKDNIRSVFGKKIEGV